MATPILVSWQLYTEMYENFIPENTMEKGLYITTVRCRYNAVNFITNIHKRHPMARPLGRGMGCLLWIQHLIDIMSQFLQLLMQNLAILDRVLTALDLLITCLSRSSCKKSPFVMLVIVSRSTVKLTSRPSREMTTSCHWLSSKRLPAFKDVSPDAVAVEPREWRKQLI